MNFKKALALLLALSSLLSMPAFAQDSRSASAFSLEAGALVCTQFSDLLAQEPVAEAGSSVEPTAEATVAPSADPTVEATIAPSADPTVEATVAPSAEPTVEATVASSAEPTVEATVAPSAEPTVEATVAPSADPTAEVTLIPSAEPTAEATVVPSAEPTAEVTLIPSAEPTAEATAVPSAEPTMEATLAPSAEPTVEATLAPTAEPTVEATLAPSAEPTVEATLAPTAEPTVEATLAPSVEPTLAPTASPAPGFASAILPQQGFLLLGKGERVPLPGYSLVPENSIDTVSYYSSSADLEIDPEDGVLRAKETGSFILTLIAEGGAKAELPVTVLPSPKKIDLSAERTKLCVGESLRCIPSLPEGSAGSVSYSVNKPDLLRSNGDGSFTALAKGKVRITARSYNDRSDSIYIQITEAPSSLRLSAAQLSLTAGECHRLSADLTGGSCPIVFSSSDESVAAVSADGVITARALGEAEIIATACNGLSARCILQVCPAAEALSLAIDRTQLGVKESLRLSAAFFPEGSGGRLQYASSNPRVASVSADGLVTALKEGSAIISAATASGASASIELKVLSAPRKLSLSADRSLLGLGESLYCTAVLPAKSAGAVRFTVSDPAVLSDNGDGSFTAVSTGKATITATSYNGKSAKLQIEVLNAPESLMLNQTAHTLGLQDSFTLVPTLPENSVSAIRFTSSNPAVASVDTDGSVTALSLGEAIITAEACSGASAQCTFTVVPAPEQLIVSMASTLIGIKERMPISVTLLPEGSAAGLSFSSSRAKAASVSADGVVTGHYESEVTITVTTHNGLKQTIAVEVDKAPRSVSLSVDNVTPAVGETVSVETSIPRYSAGSISLSTDRPDVLEIQSDGSVRAIGPGTAVLTAATFNGKTASVTLSVPPVPEEIFLPAQLRMGLGTSDTLYADLPAGTAGVVTYESLNPDIVRTSADGRLEALALGEAVIRAVAVNSGASALCSITVLPLPQQILLGETRMTLMLGQIANVDCSFLPADSYSVLTLESADPEIVAVDARGRLVALNPGTTAVIATSANGLSASLAVNVPKAPKDISLSDRYLRLADGETHALSHTLSEGSQTIVTYESNKPEVASVDSASGLITAHATGTACITARTLNGLHASCTVSVNIDTANEETADDELEIIFMDIERNDGIILRCGDEYAFIDSGLYRNGKDALAYMQSLGITHLKYYIGTHAHEDHVGGAGVIIEALGAELVIAPHSYVFDCILRFCKTDAEKAAVRSTPTYVMRKEDVIYLGGAKITCIGPVDCRPHSYKSSSENENSLVTRVEYGETSFLLTGDATRDEMIEIEEAYPGSTRADVFKNPHHNGYQPMSVIEKVMPKIVVFSTSNRARPENKYRRMFESLGSEIYITAPAEHSHITITSDGKSLNVETASTPKPK